MNATPHPSDRAPTRDAPLSETRALRFWMEHDEGSGRRVWVRPAGGDGEARAVLAAAPADPGATP